jgi:hypothetical protein
MFMGGNMFHQRALNKILIVLIVLGYLMLRFSGFGSLGAYGGVMLGGFVLFCLINRFAPKRDWYPHEDEESGFTHMNLSGPTQNG